HDRAVRVEARRRIVVALAATPRDSEAGIQRGARLGVEAVARVRHLAREEFTPAEARTRTEAEVAILAEKAGLERDRQLWFEHAIGRGATVEPELGEQHDLALGRCVATDAQARGVIARRGGCGDRGWLLAVDLGNGWLGCRRWGL